MAEAYAQSREVRRGRESVVEYSVHIEVCGFVLVLDPREAADLRCRIQQALDDVERLRREDENA